MKFRDLEIKEAFKYGNNYYRKQSRDSAEEAASGVIYVFRQDMLVHKDGQTKGKR